MIKNLNAISSKISRGQDLNTNLEKYGTSMASLYHDLALIKLSMNYYTLCDMYYDMLQDGVFDNELLDDTLSSNPLWIEFYNRFQLLIHDYLNQQMDIDQIKTMRQELIDIMNEIVSFIDQFGIYEYILNRVEYRFKDKEKSPFDKEYYNTYLTNDLMHYIFSDEDKMVINGKIVELVEQLPMRLSKERFFSYLREAFALYHGAQKGTIDDFNYAIRSAALLPVSKKQTIQNTAYEPYFNDCKEIAEMLEKVDYGTIDDATYHKLREKLTAGIQDITIFADDILFLTELLNDLYTIELLESDGMEDTTQTVLAKKIIKNIHKHCFTSQEELTLKKKPSIKGFRDKAFEKIEEQFIAFEGVQENMLSIVEKNEYVLDDAWHIYENQLDSFGMRTLFDTLKTVTKLQSGSYFVRLDEDETCYEIPDASYADKVCECLIDDMRQAFQGWKQPVRRAVMAAAFAQLPVLFNNVDEVQNYINISLMQCRDEAEQAAVMEILESIMEG